MNITNEHIDYTILETLSVFQAFRYAVIPQIMPAIVSLAILIFCESWNMVEQALILLCVRQRMMAKIISGFMTALCLTSQHISPHLARLRQKQNNLRIILIFDQKKIYRPYLLQKPVQNPIA